MTEEKERLSMNVPKSLKRKLEAEATGGESMTDIVVGSLEQRYSGDEYQLRQELEDAKEELEFHESKIGKHQEKRDDVLERIDRIESELAELEATKEEYHRWLDAILDEREAGVNPLLFPDSIRAMDGFEEFNKSAQEVHEDLKDRAINQERRLRESDFTEGRLSHSNGPYLHEAADRGSESRDDVNLTSPSTCSSDPE